MLIERIELARGNDGDWEYDEYYFACAEQFDRLFGLSEEVRFCDLLIFDSEEEDCKEIFIEPITDEEQENAPIIDYDLFYCVSRLTENGTYQELRKKIRNSPLAKGGFIWVRVE